MIRLSQVTLRRGTKTLLEGAEVALNPGDKIGLIGANGSGKSSLFALLRGELHADKSEGDYPRGGASPTSRRRRLRWSAPSGAGIAAGALRLALDRHASCGQLRERRERCR
jgi:ATP-binding cassette subfamily F protein 3